MMSICTKGNSLKGLQAFEKQGKPLKKQSTLVCIHKLRVVKYMYILMDIQAVIN